MVTKFYKLLSVLILLSTVLFAVSPAIVSAAPPPGTIVDVAKSDPRFKTLVAAVQAAGLTSTLEGAGPFTVLAPTNAAFDKLGKKTIAALLADPTKLSNILLYHTLAGKHEAAEVVTLTSAVTVNGAPVVITLSNGKVYINDARVIITDIQASNGVIHAIDTVLLPPSKDIVDTIASYRRLDTLGAAIAAADLTATLKGPGPFTIFAPTNAAFNALGKKTVNALLADKTALTNVLLYHALSGAVYSGDAAKLTHAATINGADIAITEKNGDLYINDARVVINDVLATNGVVHIIDAVLLPPSKDIVDTIDSNNRLDTLSAAITAADLTATLKGAGPFTIFAPTDAAFNALGKKTINALLADKTALTNVLLYHAVSGRVYSGDAAKLTHAATINGADVVITRKWGGLYINDARVVVKNVIATNGVIHIIDAVLLPPSKDIMQIVDADPRLDTLSAAIAAADLTSTLKGSGPFTLFAPTDAAFNKLGKKAIDALLADKTALTNVLLYHAVSGRLYSGDVKVLSTIHMVNGGDVTVSMKLGRLYINNARVVVSDIQATNGVIHVINTVLIP